MNLLSMRRCGRTRLLCRLVAAALVLQICACAPEPSHNPALRDAGAVLDSPTRLAAQNSAPKQTVVAKPAQPELGVVLGSVVNVRTGTGAEHSVAGRLHCGDVVAILETARDWYLVQMGELTGYANSAYLVKVKAGMGRIPTCEFPHVKLVPHRRPRPTNIPAVPTPSKQLSREQRQAPAAPDQTSTGAIAAAPKPAKTSERTSTPAPAPAAPAHVQPPKTVSLSIAGVKPSVLFPHGRHREMFDCAQCHHPLNGSGPNLEKNCHTCHSPGGKGRSSVSNKDAFHQTCRACHEVTGQGPTACAQCHNGQKP